MAGNLSHESVARLKETVSRFRSLSREVRVLEQSIKKQSAAMRVLEPKRNAAHAEVLKLLHEMDCASNGNFGWESRITWMLAELTKR